MSFNLKSVVEKSPLIAFMAGRALPLQRIMGKISKTRGGAVIMKKLFLILAAIPIIGLAITSKSYAAPSDNAYVIVRCTVDIHVDVLDTADKVYIGTLQGEHYNAGPNSDYVSSHVTVKNTSLGAITKWSLAITGQQQSANPFSGFEDPTSEYPAWSYGSAWNDNGINRMVIGAVFKQSAAESADFAAGDILTTSPQHYQPDTARFGPNNNAYPSVISGSANNMVAPGQERNLYFRVLTPSAVTDDHYRRIQVTVTASMGL